MCTLNLIDLACGDVESTLHSREEDGTNEKAIAADPHVITKEAADSSEPDPELCILEERFGELTNGKVIEVSLQELLNILPRTRRRSDAYRPLQKRLYERGVTLQIIPNNPKKRKHYEGELD